MYALLAIVGWVPQLALKGLDPVALVSGQEMPGNPQITQSFGKFTYAFATSANRNRFRESPGDYAIQWGGACGAMGPLSGHGNPDRWSVFEGRIWIFASDTCRTQFDADPDARIRSLASLLPIQETEDPKARDAHASAVRAHHAEGLTGGMWAFRTRYPDAGEYTDTWSVAPDRWTFATGKTESPYLYVAGRDAQYRESDGKGGQTKLPIDEETAEEVRVVAQGSPIGVLSSSEEPYRFAANVRMKGSDETFDSYYIGPARVYLHRSDRTIAAIESPNRVAGIPAMVLRRYSKLAEFGGVRLPTAQSEFRDGKWQPESVVEIAKIDRGAQ